MPPSPSQGWAGPSPGNRAPGEQRRAMRTQMGSEKVTWPGPPGSRWQSQAPGQWPSLLSGTIPDLLERCMQTTAVRPKPPHVTTSRLSPMPPPPAVKPCGLQPVPPRFAWRGEKGNRPTCRASHQLRLQGCKPWGGAERIFKPHLHIPPKLYEGQSPLLPPTCFLLTTLFSGSPEHICADSCRSA